MGTLNVNEQFPNRFLSGADLPDGQKVIRTIETVDEEDMTVQENGRPMVQAVYVMYFVESPTDANGEKRGLKINKTIARSVAKLYGPDSDDWIGKRLILFAENITAFGDVYNVIRVMPQIPPATAKRVAVPTLADLTPDPKAKANGKSGGQQPVGDPGEELFAEDLARG
jgi:hypothetical protein